MFVLTAKSQAVLLIFCICIAVLILIACYNSVKREYEKYGLDEEEYLPNGKCGALNLKQFKTVIIIAAIIIGICGTFFTVCVANNFTNETKRNLVVNGYEERLFKNAYGDYFGTYDYDKLTDEEKSLISEYHDSEYDDFDEFIKNKYDENKQ